MNKLTTEELFNGKTVWQGVVEVFDIEGHPKAKRAYAWSHASGKDDSDERFVAVLELLPVESALTAVRVSLVKQIRRIKSENAKKKPVA